MQVASTSAKTKGLIWLLGAGAFALAGWTFYDIFTQKQDKHYDAQQQLLLDDVLQRNVPDSRVHDKKFYPREDREALGLPHRRHGPREGEAAGPLSTAENPKPKAPPIDTIVQIGLIVWSPQPARRFAAITYKTGGGAPPARRYPPTTVASKQERLPLRG